MAKTFLESVHNLTDGPKVPYHLDYRRIDGETCWYVTDDIHPSIFRGPFTTPQAAETQRDQLNKEFREAGSTGPSKV